MKLGFFVAGTAVPQGSMIKSRYGGIHHANSNNLDAWRMAVATEARQVMAGNFITREPLIVIVEFYLSRPKAHYGVRSLRPAAPKFPGRPDIDKLLRAVLDALTDVVYADDAQVVAVQCTKNYSDPPGAAIVVESAIFKAEAASPTGGSEIHAHA